MIPWMKQETTYSFSTANSIFTLPSKPTEPSFRLAFPGKRIKSISDIRRSFEIMTSVTDKESNADSVGSAVASVFVPRIAAELGLSARDVGATVSLLTEGGTVPFIARYRKEATGSLDEVAITKIRDRMSQLGELEARRSAILKSLGERNLLTDALKRKVGAAESLTGLEDVYAPFRPKRRTRATIAREKGLEPLADWLFVNQSAGDPLGEAAKFVVQSDDKNKAVPTAVDALAGARDILAERFSDDTEARCQVRKLFESEAIIRSKATTGKESDPEAAKYRDYFTWSEPLSKTPSHRLLAMRRGEKAGHLLIRVEAPEDKAVGILNRLFVRGRGLVSQQIESACEDSYQRLLASSMETESRLVAKKAADAKAVQVFAENVRELLMAPPLGQKKMIAIDPAFRTGCKLVVLDAQGKLLFHDVIYPTSGSASQIEEARRKIIKLAEHYGVEAVAIGNGTASRETEAFVQQCGLSKSVSVVMVNESGASIYSASDVAREEFPDKDITVRGAVSIGRRLMDPLAELVKIDAKSIGVGQYQHDVDQTMLKQSLDDVVVFCVNRVGVEVNTASRNLLSYVSGLNATIAGNIVKHRNEHGPFKSRRELMKVPRLGAKSFEQAAGFLRIREAKNPLDASAVHPESYPVVERMAKDLCSQVADLMRDANLRIRIKLENYVDERTGLPTLQDILDELAKPGRDPRKQFEAFQFASGVEKPGDLRPGMKLPGVVTNVTAFGAFVDIGVHQDGLVHISQLADQFVKNPAEVVKVSQKVTVIVLEVDLDRKRIALSMKANPELGTTAKRDAVKRGDSNSGKPPAPAGGASRPHGFGDGSLTDALDKAFEKGK